MLETHRLTGLLAMVTKHVSYEESIYPNLLIERLGGLETYYQNSQERQPSLLKK